MALLHCDGRYRFALSLTDSCSLRFQDSSLHISGCRDGLGPCWASLHVGIQQIAMQTARDPDLQPSCDGIGCWHKVATPPPGGGRAMGNQSLTYCSERCVSALGRFPSWTMHTTQCRVGSREGEMMLGLQCPLAPQDFSPPPIGGSEAVVPSRGIELGRNVPDAVAF